MSTLRVLLKSAPESGRADAWALFDDNERLLQTGRSEPGTWPDAEHMEAVLAATCVRIVGLHLPPMPADRVAAAAAFALEDQLAGPADEQHIAVSAQRADGTVEAIVANRDLVARLSTDFDRVLAEPALAPRPMDKHWCWYASAAGGGFVRKPNGAAFATGEPQGSLPVELQHALDHAARVGNSPVAVERAFNLEGATARVTAQDVGTAFVAADAWQWDVAGHTLFAGATNLLQGEFADVVPVATRSYRRLFRVAAIIAVVALGLHVVATLGEWATLRIESWRANAALASLARDAGVIGNDAPAVAIARRYAESRHRAGLAAPADALPLLALAAPALATLPAGMLRTAIYADAHWTFDLVKPEPAVAERLERQLASAGLVTLLAVNAVGLRMRVTLATGAP
ncbi:MAG: type II secretion system protein GspL [Betaproteobacteria bacterium]